MFDDAVSVLILRALKLARLAEALVGANAPELIDLRGPLEAFPADGWAILWRRARVLAEGAVSPAAFGPFGRCTSLFRRAEAPRVRSDTLPAYVWFSQGFVGGPVSRFSPELPFPGTGKWFKLGSPMMLL